MKSRKVAVAIIIAIILNVGLLGVMVFQPVFDLRETRQELATARADLAVKTSELSTELATARNELALKTEALSTMKGGLEQTEAKIATLESARSELEDTLVFRQAVGQFALALLGMNAWDDPDYVSVWDAILGNSTGILSFEYDRAAGTGILKVPVEDVAYHYFFSTQNREFVIKVVDAEGNVLDEISSSDLHSVEYSGTGD